MGVNVYAWPYDSYKCTHIHKGKIHILRFTQANISFRFTCLYLLHFVVHHESDVHIFVIAPTNAHDAYTHHCLCILNDYVYHVHITSAGIIIGCLFTMTVARRLSRASYSSACLFIGAFSCEQI